MLHLRIVSPRDRTDAVLRLLREDDATFNLALLRDAALSPAGDLVLCDIAREGVNPVLHALRELGIDEQGSISVEQIAVSVSVAAAAAERRAPGYGTDAAVWEEVDARVRDESFLTAGFVAFIVVASLIAAIGLMEDSPILIVGAMVVGPEFGPIIGLALGLYKRRMRRIRVAATTLAAGLSAGSAAAFLGTWASERLGLVPAGFSPHAQPFTGFIVDPTAFSFVVALLAGVVGTLSLTQARAGALIGVLISVTTVPAAAAIGVAGALGSWDDALGAAAQLALNLAALVVASILTLAVQRRQER